MRGRRYGGDGGEKEQKEEEKKIHGRRVIKV
jgi:hypothetical protein